MTSSRLPTRRCILASAAWFAGSLVPGVAFARSIGAVLTHVRNSWGNAAAPVAAGAIAAVRGEVR
jgi:hypothetical protein